MGKLIVIEGLDGSGKATQAKLLHEALCAKGVSSMKVTFPNYDSPSSTLAKMYLDGEFGKNADDVNAYAASSFYSVDRYASYKTVWGKFYHEGGLVVADRYTTSNAVHQCSKLPPEQWDAFLQWLFSFEYEKIAIPKPDMVLYLDVDPDTSQQLMTKRYDGNEAQKDIHEKDMEYLLRSRSAAKYCAKTLGWQRVACTEGASMRSKQSIHEEILNIVLSTFNL